jgi:hypothetical protein
VTRQATTTYGYLLTKGAEKCPRALDRLMCLLLNM